MLEAVRLKGERWTHVRAYMKTDKTTRQLCERYKFYLDPSINWNDFTIYEDAILKKKVGNNKNVLSRPYGVSIEE